MFFDEIDALVSARSETGDSSGGVQQRMLAALLNEMDGIDRVAGVLVVSNCACISLTTDGVDLGQLAASYAAVVIQYYTAFAMQSSGCCNEPHRYDRLCTATSWTV